MELTPKGNLTQSETAKSSEKYCHHALTLSLSLNLSTYVIIVCV